MSKKVLIDVTQECIDKGVRGDCELCAVAIAARNCELFGECRVRDTYLFASRSYGGPGRIELPMIAQQFIKRFDGVATVKPFSFEVEVPDE